MTRPAPGHPVLGHPVTQHPAPSLSRAELRRYSRPLLLDEWGEAAQERLRAARVLVVGAGGLGAPAIAYLAGAGVGALSVADGDAVGLSNLHRQTLYSTADVGRPKAQVAAARAQAVNPNVRVAALPALTPETAAAQVAAHDLTLDCTDNFESRYLLNDACVAAGQRWVWGAAGGLEGMVSVFSPARPLRRVFPSAEGAESCDAIGVLGPLVGVIGSLMAAEALKLLSQPDGEAGAEGAGPPNGMQTLEGHLLTYDLRTARVRRLALRPAHESPPRSL